MIYITTVINLNISSIQDLLIRINIVLFLYTDSLEHYWSTMIGAKMLFSTASMSDLPDGDEGLMTTNSIRLRYCLGDDIIDDDNEGRMTGLKQT